MALCPLYSIVLPRTARHIVLRPLPSDMPGHSSYWSCVHNSYFTRSRAKRLGLFSTSGGEEAWPCLEVPLGLLAAALRAAQSNNLAPPLQLAKRSSVRRSSAQILKDMLDDTASPALHSPRCSVQRVPDAILDRLAPAAEGRGPSHLPSTRPRDAADDVIRRL